MLKLAQFLSYKDITVLVGNIEGPYGWSLHVCLAPAGALYGLWDLAPNLTHGRLLGKAPMAGST